MIGGLDVVDADRASGRHDLGGDILAPHQRLWRGEAGTDDR